MALEVTGEMGLVGVAKLGRHRRPSAPTRLVVTCLAGCLGRLDNAPPPNHERWADANLLVEKTLECSQTGACRCGQVLGSTHRSVVFGEGGDTRHLSSFGEESRISVVENAVESMA